MFGRKKRRSATQLDIELRLEKMRRELEALRAAADGIPTNGGEPPKRRRSLASIREAVRQQPIAYSGLTMATGALFGALFLRR